MTTLSIASAGAGGYWSSVSDLATLQSEMAFVVTDLIDGARKEYALGPMQSTELREALVEGITYTRLRDVDLGDGLGGRDVTPGETRTRGMLRLTNLLTASADRVTLMPAEELATADRDSRHWRWVVEGAQDPFLPEQSLLLGESYTEALQHLGRIESWVLVLGLIQAVVLMPISVAVSLMRIRRLVRAKKRLFSIFLGVPRPVLYTMAASAATVEGVGEGGQNGAKDLSATLSEDEKRAAKRLEKGKGTGKGIERLLRFEEPRQELKADTWRLQALVVIPLGVMTLICLATHLIAYFFLSKAEFPIGALETVFRVRVRTARVRRSRFSLAMCTRVVESSLMMRWSDFLARDEQVT